MTSQAEKDKLTVEEIKVLALLAEAKSKRFASVEIHIQDGKLVSSKLTENIRY